MEAEIGDVNAGESKISIDPRADHQSMRGDSSIIGEKTLDTSELPSGLFHVAYRYVKPAASSILPAILSGEYPLHCFVEIMPIIDTGVEAEEQSVSVATQPTIHIASNLGHLTRALTPYFPLPPTVPVSYAQL